MTSFGSEQVQIQMCVCVLVRVSLHVCVSICACVRTCGHACTCLHVIVTGNPEFEFKVLLNRTFYTMTIDYTAAGSTDTSIYRSCSNIRHLSTSTFELGNATHSVRLTYREMAYVQKVGKSNWCKLRIRNAAVQTIMNNGLCTSLENCRLTSSTNRTFQYQIFFKENETSGFDSAWLTKSMSMVDIRPITLELDETAKGEILLHFLFLLRTIDRKAVVLQCCNFHPCQISAFEVTSAYMLKYGVESTHALLYSLRVSAE